MATNQKIGFFSVPKVSIDGKSHADILLIAVSSGFFFALIIMTIVFFLISNKNSKETKNSAELNQSTVSIESQQISTISKNSSKTNLLRIFGGSTQSFDVCRSTNFYPSPNKDNFATVFVDIDKVPNQYNAILTPAMFDTSKNIKTVVC